MNMKLTTCTILKDLRSVLCVSLLCFVNLLHGSEHVPVVKWSGAGDGKSFFKASNWTADGRPVTSGAIVSNHQN